MNIIPTSIAIQAQLQASLRDGVLCRELSMENGFHHVCMHAPRSMCTLNEREAFVRIPRAVRLSAASVIRYLRISSSPMVVSTCSQKWDLPLRNCRGSTEVSSLSPCLLRKSSPISSDGSPTIRQCPSTATVYKVNTRKMRP